MSPELEHIRREAERIAGTMKNGQWRQAPPGKWNCAQILEHLRLTYTATTKGTLKAMEIGKPLGGKPTLRDRVSTFWVAGLGLFPAGREAPEYTVPKAHEGTESLRQFNDALVAMDSMLADAERRFGTGVKLLDHPVIGPLTAQQWRRFHRTHARHHLKQLKQRAKDINAGTA